MWSFSPESVSVTLAGSLSLEGFNEGEFVTVEKDEDNYKLKRVASGTAARTKVISSTYTIKIVLNGGSKHNNTLDTLLKADILGDKAKFPILIKDQSGSSFFFSSQAWVEKESPLKFSTSSYVTEWTIRASDGILRNAGNEEINEIENAISMAASTIPFISDLIKKVNG